MYSLYLELAQVVIISSRFRPLKTTNGHTLIYAQTANSSFLAKFGATKNVMRDETDPKSRFKFSQKLSRTCFSLPLIITFVPSYEGTKVPSRRYCIRLLKTFVVYEGRICWIWIPRRLWISRNFLRRYLYVVYLTLVQKRQIDNTKVRRYSPVGHPAVGTQEVRRQ